MKKNKHPPLIQGIIICNWIGAIIIVFLQPKEIAIAIGVIAAAILIPWSIGTIYQRIFKND